MRTLLLGKAGQIGFELQRALAPLGVLYAFDRTKCDLRDEAALRTAIRELSPNVIVNAAAYTQVDQAEIDEKAATAVNATAPWVMGQEAAQIGALVVHYSSDYVFDGYADGYYKEADITRPLSAYGRTKLQGEDALGRSGARHLIFRTSWVAGTHGQNFAKKILRLADERDVLQVVADQFGAPTSAALIADVSAHAIRQALYHPRSVESGVYHLVAQGETSWHGYACYIVDFARRAGREVRVCERSILPVSTAEYPALAKRPQNSRLDTAKLRHTFGLVMPPWQTGLDHLLQQML